MNTINSIFVCVCGGVGVYTWKPEDNLQELVLSSYIGGSGDHTQVIMVSGFPIKKVTEVYWN